MNGSRQSSARTSQSNRGMLAVPEWAQCWYLSTDGAPGRIRSDGGPPAPSGMAVRMPAQSVTYRRRGRPAQG